jgi:hypothetical protein
MSTPHARLSMACTEVEGASTAPILWFDDIQVQ